MNMKHTLTLTTLLPAPLAALSDDNAVSSAIDRQWVALSPSTCGQTGPSFE